MPAAFPVGEQPPAESGGQAVVRYAAGVGEQVADGDPVASRVPGDVPRQRVVQGEFALLDELEIADLLVIARSTAKTHVKRIMTKIGARDRAQAVVLAYRAGLMGRGTP